MATPLRRIVIAGILVLVFTFAALSSPLVGAKRLQPTPEEGGIHGDREPTTRSVASSASSLHNGYGPFGPPPTSDSLFQTDSGPSLDQYLYRSSSPILIDVPVHRVVGRTNSAGYLIDWQKLVSNGVIASNARITLLAWDVDEDYVGSIAPEIDRVYVNGQYVGDLSGANDTWSTVTFEVPIQYLKFARSACREFGDSPGQQYLSECSSSPITTTNQIRIDIDTGNTSDNWAVEVDWTSIFIEAAPPLLFIPGMGHSNDTSLPCTFDGGGELTTANGEGCFYWDDDDGTYFMNFRGILSSHGFLTAITEDFLGGGVGMRENAKRLVPLVNKLKARYGVDQIGMVGHSKGGLDARAYISGSAAQGNNVEELVTIGSPHHGSHLSDLCLSIERACLIFRDVTTALRQVSEDYMVNTFNKQYRGRSDVDYVSINGDASLGTSKAPEWQYESVTVWGSKTETKLAWDILKRFGDWNGANDFLVTVRSSMWSGIEGHSSDNSITLAPFNRNHHTIRAGIGKAGERDESVADAVEGIFKVGGPGSMTADVSDPMRASQAEPQPGALTIYEGEASENTMFVQPFAVDAESKLSISLLWDSGNIIFTLVDPSGMQITPSTIDPNVNYSEDLATKPKIAIFQVTDPQIGLWEAHLTTNSIPTGVSEWSLVLIQDSPLTMETKVGAEWYVVGDTVLLLSSLKEGATPVLGAVLTATVTEPSGTLTFHSLADNGTSGDAVPQDGIYTAAFPASSEGFHSVAVEADGVSLSGESFRRTDIAQFEISPQTAAIQTGLADWSSDDDGDGLLDRISITVPIQVSEPGDYLLSGVLQDAFGNVVGSATTGDSFNSGPASLLLDFDAGSIWEQAEGGVFTLVDLRLYDESFVEGSLLVDIVPIAHITQYYDPSSLDHPQIFLTGVNTDYGFDSDGNGRFDWLVSEIGVNVAAEGYYEWNARLVALDGHEYGWSSGENYLEKGNSTITLWFDGSSIYNYRQSGPYLVADLAMWGNGWSLLEERAAQTQPYAYTRFGDSPVYLSPLTKIILDNVAYDDEDILTYDDATGEWSLYFDGSQCRSQRRPMSTPSTCWTTAPS